MLKKRFITGLYILLLISLTIFLPFRLQHGVSMQTRASSSEIMASQFNNDAFYYLNLTRNHSEKGFTTYDKEYPTNGYQYLWQQLLILTSGKETNIDLLIKFAYRLCLLFTVISYVLLFLSIYKFTGSNILSVLTIIPGFFYLTFDKLTGWNYSPWSLINGMESSLAVLIFSIFLLMFSYHSIEKDINKFYFLIVGLVLSLLILARLDEVFLLAGLVTTVILTKLRKNKIKEIFLILLIPLIVIVLFIIFNQINYGTFLPVSGLSKTEFYPRNLMHLIHTIYTGRSFDFLFGEHLYSRVLPLMVPMLIVILLSKKLLNNSYFSFNNKHVILIRSLKYYVIFKSMYLLFFVDFWKQGFWYFFIPVIIMNIFIIMWIKTIIGERINSNGFQLIAIILILVLTNGYYLSAENISIQKIKSGKLNFTEVERIIDSTISKGKILEIDDGIIASSVNNKCMSGTGLCLDRKAYESNIDGRILETASKRGYRYMASLNYFKKPELIPENINSSADFFEISIDKKFYDESLKFKYSLILADKKTGLVMVKFDKK